MNNIKRGNFRGNATTYQSQNRGGYLGNNSRNDSSSNSRSRSGSKTSTKRDRIRCYKCKECDTYGNSGEISGISVILRN